MIYLAVFVLVGLFFHFGRRSIISDQKLNNLSFEFMAYGFFMLCIWLVALMMVGSWNCAKDRVMKAMWALFIIVYLAEYTVFR